MTGLMPEYYHQTASNAMLLDAASSVIVHPNDLDIICGSGKTVTTHPGNKRFQNIVAKHYLKYSNAATKSERMKVTQKVMNELLASGCTRFLKKDPIFERYYVANKRAGRDKVSHSLRHIRNKEGRMHQRPCAQQQVHQAIASVMADKQSSCEQVITLVGSMNHQAAVPPMRSKVFPFLESLNLPTRSRTTSSVLPEVLKPQREGQVCNFRESLPPLPTSRPLSQSPGLCQPISQPSEHFPVATESIEPVSVLPSDEQHQPLYGVPALLEHVVDDAQCFEFLVKALFDDSLPPMDFPTQTSASPDAATCTPSPWVSTINSLYGQNQQQHMNQGRKEEAETQSDAKTVLLSYQNDWEIDLSA